MPAGLTPALLGLVAYSYIGYPLLVSGMARLRRERPGPPAGFTPSVTVIISALDEEDVIEGKLRNVLDSDYPRDLLDVVVVADGSVDRTAERARGVGDDRVRVLHDPVRGGKAAAMTRGVAVARGEILVFTDANNTLGQDAIRVLAAHFADPDIGGVSGAKTIGDGAASAAGERLYWAYESSIKQAESRLGFCASAIGELVAVRSDIALDFPHGLVNDDFYLVMQVARSGHRMVYAPSALSVEPAAAESDEVTRRRRIAAGRWQALAWWRRSLPLSRPVVMWEVMSHKYLRLLLPFAMGGAVVATSVDAVRGRRGARPLLASQLALYGMAAVAPVIRGPRPVQALASGARYIVASNLAVALGLSDYLRSRHSLHLWARAHHATLASPSDRGVTDAGHS